MPEEKSQEQLEYEKELRRRIKILQEKFNSGKIRFSKELDIEEIKKSFSCGKSETQWRNRFRHR